MMREDVMHWGAHWFAGARPGVFFRGERSGAGHGPKGYTGPLSGGNRAAGGDAVRSRLPDKPGGNAAPPHNWSRVFVFVELRLVLRSWAGIVFDRCSSCGFAVCVFEAVSAWNTPANISAGAKRRPGFQSRGNVRASTSSRGSHKLADPIIFYQTARSGLRPCAKNNKRTAHSG